MFAYGMQQVGTGYTIPTQYGCNPYSYYGQQAGLSGILLGGQGASYSWNGSVNNGQTTYGAFGGAGSMTGIPARIPGSSRASDGVPAAARPRSPAARSSLRTAPRRTTTRGASA